MSSLCQNCGQFHEGATDCLVVIARAMDSAEQWVNFFFQCLTAFMLCAAVAGICACFHQVPQ